MQAVILAAGRGTRLGPLTKRRSKAMLPVAGRPLVGRVLERLEAAGLGRWVVVGAPDDRALADYCASLSYVVQPVPRGMAHALACAAPLIDGPFLLCACDNLVPGDFIATLAARLETPGVDGVLALLPMSPERLQHSAAVELAADGRVQRIVEKPPPGSTESEAGSIAVYGFTPRVLDYLDVPLSPRGEQELQGAIQALIDAGGDVRGLFAPGRRTVTRPADLLALNLHYLEREGGVRVAATLPPGTRLTPPVRIERGVQVGAGCAIGPRAFLEAGCRLGKGVVVRDAVLLRESRVLDGAEIVEMIWGDDG